MRRYGNYEHEVFYALWLDSKHQVLKARELFRSTVDGASVYPREVIKEGLSCNAAAVIFAHKHQDKYKGNPDPHNQNLAFEKLFKDIMLQRRKDDLEFYKLFAGDEAFKTSLMQSMQRIVDTEVDRF